MTQTLNNGIVVPVPSDPYNPPADMKKMGDTTDTVRRINSPAALAAISNLRIGTTIVRTDQPGMPHFSWDGANWIAVAPEINVGQSGNRAIIKGREQLCPTTAFATARVVFDTPFPNECSSISLVNSTSTVTVATMRVITRNREYVEFAAYRADGSGVINTGLYVNYIAVGY